MASIRAGRGIWRSVLACATGLSCTSPGGSGADQGKDASDGGSTDATTTVPGGTGPTPGTGATPTTGAASAGPSSTSATSGTDPSGPTDAAATDDSRPPPMDTDTDTGGVFEAEDRCDVAIFDAAAPPVSLELSGNLGAHDPVVTFADGQYWYFSTGNGIATKTSPDLLAWAQRPDVFATTPAWFRERVPAYEPRNIWAPDISFFGGRYHLYYSVSSFGSNRSCIGHATRPSLSDGAWTDHEDVVCSNLPGQDDDWNAIDANVVLDPDGTPWMALGSFWSGIKMVRLDLEGNWADTEVHDLASRGGGSIEAPFIVRRCGFYYLFVSFGACCQGVDSTYNIRVGRSEDLLGPYVDRDGTPLMQGGGTLVLEGGGDWVGPGHNAILFDGDRAYNIYHAYAASNGAASLRISEIAWGDDAWPISAGP